MSDETSPESYDISFTPTLRTTRADLATPPTRLSAGNVLGFSTQNPARAEFATPAAAAPRALRNATVHTRRPASRFELDTADGALLELLRDRARYSGLPETFVEKDYGPFRVEMWAWPRRR